MRDLLVRYLLGELDASERQLVEDKLRESAELRRELAYLRACLPAADAELPPPNEPPVGLVERTCGWITGDEDYLPVPAGGSRALVAAGESGTHTPTWSLADLTVATGVFLAVSMLFLPALRQSRDCARRLDCANNQHQIGTFLALFADAHDKMLPRVGPYENAGIYSVDIVENELVGADELARLLVCRSSTLADGIKTGRVKMFIPSNRTAFLHLPKEEQDRARQLMGGSYAYNIGFKQDNRYQTVRDFRSSHVPVLADAPQIEIVTVRIVNHGGAGQNVLCQDGSVRYLESFMLPQFDDNIFLNAEGKPAAGCGPQDSVLGVSWMTPAAVPSGAVPLELEFEPTAVSTAVP